MLLQAHVPKRFSAAACTQTAAAAALGFAVVFIDGRGTGLRSRAFREQSHKNLGDGSGGPGAHTEWRTQMPIEVLRNAVFVTCVPDHPHVIRAMAKKWKYMDLGNNVDNIGT